MQRDDCKLIGCSAIAAFVPMSESCKLPVSILAFSARQFRCGSVQTQEDSAAGSFDSIWLSSSGLPILPFIFHTIAHPHPGPLMECSEESTARVPSYPTVLVRTYAYIPCHFIN